MIKYNDRITPFIEKADLVQWLSKCGTASLQDGVSPLKNWKQARIACESTKWEKFLTAAMNRRFELLWKAGLRERDINNLADEVEVISNNILKSVLANIIIKNDNIIIHKIKRDINHILSEVNSSHLVKPIFALPIAWPWYERGHLPCGWDGKMISHNWKGNGPEDLPSGRLKVF